MKTLKKVMLIASLLVGMSACGVPSESDSSGSASVSTAAPVTTRSVELGPSNNVVKLDSGKWEVTGADGESMWCRFCDVGSGRCEDCWIPREPSPR